MDMLLRLLLTCTSQLAAQVSPAKPDFCGISRTSSAGTMLVLLQYGCAVSGSPRINDVLLMYFA